MAVINLEADQLKTLNTEISSLDQTLLQSYLPQLENELSQIRANVQNAELNSILNTISSQFDGVKSALSTELPKLESFLDEQLQSYTTTEQEAADAVNAVVNRMQQLVGSATVAGTAGAAGAAAGATTAQSGGSRLDKYGETWSSWWGDVSSAYSDTHGLFSAVGNTAEVILDSGGAVLETAANGVSDALGGIGNAISWIFN